MVSLISGLNMHRIVKFVVCKLFSLSMLSLTCGQRSDPLPSPEIKPPQVIESSIGERAPSKYVEWPTVVAGTVGVSLCYSGSWIRWVTLPQQGPIMDTLMKPILLLFYHAWNQAKWKAPVNAWSKIYFMGWWWDNHGTVVPLLKDTL